MKKFKDLRENMASRLVSMAVKHTTPRKKSIMEERPEVGDILELELSSLDLEATIVEELEDGYVIEVDDMGEEILLGHHILDLGEEIQIKSSRNPGDAELSVDAKSQPAGKANLKATPNMLKGKLKEGSSDDAFAELNKEIEKKRTVYMDKDSGATATGPTDKNYMNNKPATSSGNTGKDYMDSKPVTPPSTGPSNSMSTSTNKSIKLKDMHPLDREQWEREKRAAGIKETYEEDNGPLTDNQINQLRRIAEAEYQGRDVSLNKPMAGDVAKSKVYVKGPSGRVVKVNFGDKNMTIKKNIPARRRSFRARHRCETPGPKHKARYWSCKAW